MIKLSITLDKRRKMADDKFPIKFRISRKGKTLYIPSGYNVCMDEWDERVRKVKKAANRNAINLSLSRRYDDMLEAILKLQAEGKLRQYSDKMLVEYLLNGGNSVSDKQLFKVQLDDMLEIANKERTKQIYKATEEKIKGYCDYDNLYLSAIDIGWLDGFVAYLKRTGCISANTRAIHLRNIRAVLNFAIKHDVISNYVFKNYHIQTSETPKRALTIEQIRALHNADLSPAQCAYRDVFFLIFYLMGINLVDLASLTTIENGRIRYIRSKTGTFYDIKVEPEAMQIITKYKGKKHLIKFFDVYSNYNDYKRHFNENLHKICDVIGIPRISSYWARHTFATLMYEIGIPFDTIADCLGHKSAQNRITQIYIKKDIRKNDIANRRLIDYVLYNKV